MFYYQPACRLSFSPEHLKAQITILPGNRNKIKEYFSTSPLAHMSSMAYSKADEDFPGRLNDFILSNIENPDIDVDLLARTMNLSRPTLYRKIKEISDPTPTELVCVARLKKAAELLICTDYKIFEVAIMSGFNSQSSFNKAFLKQFKVTPSEFQILKKMVMPPCLPKVFINQIFEKPFSILADITRKND